MVNDDSVVCVRGVNYIRIGRDGGGGGGNILAAR